MEDDALMVMMVKNEREHDGAMLGAAVRLVINIKRPAPLRRWPGRI